LKRPFKDLYKAFKEPLKDLACTDGSIVSHALIATHLESLLKVFKVPLKNILKLFKRLLKDLEDAFQRPLKCLQNTLPVLFVT
jgi:hypothetical protein